MNVIYVDSFDTSLGTFHAAATEKGLALLLLPGASEDEFVTAVKKRFPDAIVEPGGAVLEQAEAEIRAYLAGQRTGFTVPLDVTGTEFSQRVLAEVARIPYGETRTYSEIAARVGSPKAFRAVGTANAHNAVPIIIPCHRVVATSGLGGYGGGLPMKEALLKLEGAL